MKTNLKIIIVGIIVATSIILVTLEYNPKTKSFMEIISNDVKSEAIHIPDPICFVDDRSSSDDIVIGVIMETCLTLNQFEEMGCTKPMLGHILKHSNLLDYEIDGYVFLEFAGLPKGVSQEKFDECFDTISEKRILSESKINNSLEIPNAERDAKLDAGCKLYPDAGWVCPDVSETANITSNDTSVSYGFFGTQNLMNPERCSGYELCISGTMDEVIDGDTIRISGDGDFLLSTSFALSFAPELDEEGGKEARKFIEVLCPVGSEVLIDQDGLYPFDRTRGNMVLSEVHCNGVNLNEALAESKYGYIGIGYCKNSEFGDRDWARDNGCPNYN